MQAPVCRLGPSGRFPRFTCLELLEGFGADVVPILPGHLGWLTTLNAFHQKRLQLLPRLALLIVPDEVANLFTDAAVSAGADLDVNELFELIREGDVHCLHWARLCELQPYRITHGKGWHILPCTELSSKQGGLTSNS